jgi:hypothetical protein
VIDRPDQLLMLTRSIDTQCPAKILPGDKARLQQGGYSALANAKFTREGMHDADGLSCN